MSSDLAPNFITELTPEAWGKILEALGSGDFIAISFRPAREDEDHLGKANGINKGQWWICEAKYPVITEHDQGAVIRMHEQTRVFPFLLHKPYDDVD